METSQTAGESRGVVSDVLDVSLGKATVVLPRSIAISGSGGFRMLSPVATYVRVGSNERVEDAGPVVPLLWGSIRKENVGESTKPRWQCRSLRMAFRESSLALMRG